MGSCSSHQAFAHAGLTAGVTSSWQSPRLGEVQEAALAPHTGVRGLSLRCP